MGGRGMDPAHRGINTRRLVSAARGRSATTAECGTVTAAHVVTRLRAAARGACCATPSRRSAVRGAVVPNASIGSDPSRFVENLSQAAAPMGPSAHRPRARGTARGTKLSAMNRTLVMLQPAVERSGAWRAHFMHLITRRSRVRIPPPLCPSE
jgi:hypothetical protein